MKIGHSQLTVLDWNIHFRSPDVLSPVLALDPLPALVTLQEVLLGHATGITSRLREAGYTTHYSCVEAARDKRYGNVIAAQSPIAAHSVEQFGFPWPQLVAHATVGHPGAQVDVVDVHVPNGSANGWRKIETLEALRRLVMALDGRPLILVGDFNEPRWAPLQDGRIVTWGQDRIDGRWQTWSRWSFGGLSGTGERWDSAVRWFFERNSESGLRNAYWESHGFGSMEPTHLSRGEPRWYDHIFVSEQFNVVACKYRHEFRELGLSDHSALEATLGWR